jgi:hypothetical protein
MWCEIGVTRAGDWFGLEPAAALDSVRAIAKEMGVTLRDDAEMQVLAATAVAGIEAELARMQETGSLHVINTLYRRLSARAPMPYNAWIAERRLEMERAVAVAARATHRLGFGQSQRRTF